ncbi:MAG: FHA domain-containing protein, partial [Myxococcales bacterium]|nr:FHA domain-containing protein [Myxococcales bacterium]
MDARSGSSHHLRVAVRTAYVIIDGPRFASIQVALREGITSIGRLPANEIVLDDPQVSRHHARVSFFEGRATFQDLDSHNGSLVNDQRIVTATLRPGDVLRIGPFRFASRKGSGRRSGCQKMPGSRGRSSE